ncbi:MAG: hypothetical protein H6851_01560 [Geminicoccaceae bacterium]|nr:hypothetical protein [Geminicoccaceae bacterium]
MKEFFEHGAGLRVRGLLQQSWKLLRRCRILAGDTGRSQRRGRRTATDGLSATAIGVFRLMAARVRAVAGAGSRGRASLRRFAPVLDAFIAAHSAQLALTGEEAWLLRRAWLEHLEGGDATESARLLLASFRQRRSSGNATGPADPADDDPRADSIWHARLEALVLDEMALAPGVVPVRPERVRHPSTALPAAPVTAGARPLAQGRDPPRLSHARPASQPGDGCHRAIGAGMAA